MRKLSHSADKLMYNKHKMNKVRGKVSLGLLLLAIVGIVGVFAAPLAHADCGGIETAIINCDSNANPTLEIVKLVLKIMTGLVGIAAVGALIFAGIMYSSASGDQGQVQKAKTMIQNTVIGIVLYGAMFLLGNFLIPGGVFGGDITYNGNGINNSLSTGAGDGSDFNPVTTSNSTQFSIVSMPDTQFEVNKDVNNVKGSQTLLDDDMKWIVANKAENKSNIQVVVAPGDITNAGGTQTDSKITAMFKSASRSYKILDDGGVPYSITSGNHDTDATCTDSGKTSAKACVTSGSDAFTTKMRTASRLNNTFPTSRAGLKGLTLYKSGEVQNSYRIFRIRNTNWLILTMEMYPRTAVFEWAKKVVATHPTYNVVVATHGYMGSGTNIINGGISSYCGSKSDCTTPKTIQKELLKYKNVQMLFSGHVTPDNIRTDTLNGHKVVQFKTTIHACLGSIPCNNPIRTVQIDLSKGTLTSKLCRKVTATSASNCETQTISGMSYVTSTSGGGSGSGSSSTALLSGVGNFRDAATLTPQLLKPGLFYRSAKLHDATSADVTKLSSLLKNGAIIDFRTADVVKKSKDQAVPGVPNVNYQVEGVSDAKGYVRAYVNSASGRASFGKALEKIASTSGATLVHCTMGKDRTGWITAMVMYIVGDGKYSQKDLDKLVMAEYLKSLESGSDYLVDASWLNAALDAARSKYGSVMGYIKTGLGVDDATLQKIKNKLGA